MADVYDLNTTEVYDLNIEDNSLPIAQQNREYELQQKAGVEPSSDFSGTRYRMAEALHGAEVEDLYNASETALMQGANAESVAGFINNYNTYVNPEDANISLEVAAAENQLNEAYSNNPQTYSNTINSLFEEDDKDSLAKSEMLESFFQRTDDYAETFSTWNKIGSTGARLLMPIIGTQAQDQDILSEGKEVPLELSALTTTKRQQKIFEDAARNMTPQQFEQFLDQTFENIKNSGADYATIKDFVVRMREDADNTNDLIGLFEVGTPILKAVNTSIRSAKAVGDTSKAKDLIVSGLKDGNKQVILEDVIGPSATKPFQNSNTISYSTKVAEQVADTLADERANKIIQDFTKAGIMEPEEIEVYKKLTVEDFKKGLTTDVDAPVDINIDILQGKSGEYKAMLTLGTGIKGDAAMNEAVAYNYAKRLGIPEGEFDIVKGDGEGWYVRVFKPLADRGMPSVIGTGDDVKDWSVAFNKKYLKPLEGPINFVVRHFAGVSKVAERAHKQDVEAIRKLTAARVRMREVFANSYESLDKDGKELLNTIYMKGQKANEGKGVWFTTEELEDMGASEAVRKAYSDFKKVSDIDYIANNDTLVRRLNREGYSLLKTADGEELIAREANFDNVGKMFNSMLIKHGEDYISTANTTAEDFIKLYKDKGYKLYQINKRSNIYKDLNYNYILAKPSEINVTALPRFITNYLPGGRRRYTYGTLFVKIGRRLYAGGKEMNGYSKVLRAGLDEKELQLYADEVNKAIDIAKKAEEGVGVADLDAMIARENFQYFKVDNWEHLSKLIRSKDNPRGLIDTNYRAMVLEDGEQYIYNNGLASVLDDPDNLDDALQDLVDLRADYSRHRNNLLESVNGDKSRILSVGEIYDSTINKAAYSMALGDLHNWYGKEFRKNFLKVIDRSGGYDPARYSDQELVRTAKILSSDEVPEEMRPLVRAATNFQMHYLRIANARTKWDKYTQRFMKRTAQALDCYVPGIERGGAVFETVAKSDPSKVMRALGFQSAMGWWNPAQLIKQGLGIMNTVALAPIQGTRAMMMYPFIRMARAFEGNSKMVQRIFEACSRMVGGVSKKDFDGILKYMNQYGSWDSTKMLVGMDSGHQAFLSRNNLLSKTLRSQYFFMNEGTNANYVIADIAAYLSKKDKSFAEIAAYSDDLFVNMTKASESAFQAGQAIPSAMLAQWLSYPTRMIEAMFNKRLTKFQRSRLFASQVAMWGVAGTFGDDETALNLYSDLKDAGVNDYWAGVITNGLFTQWAAEYGINFAEGLGIKEILENEFPYDFAKSEFRLPNIPAAKAIPQGMAVLKALKELIYPEVGERDVYNYFKMLATTKHMPSGPRNLGKAVVAWHIGKFSNNYKDVIKDDVSKSQVLAQLLGFGPTEMRESSYIYEALNNVEDTVDDLYKDLEPYIDAMLGYQESLGFTDPHEREQEFNRIATEYDIKVREYIAALEDTYQDSKAASMLASRLAEALEGPKQDTEEKRQKVYENAGENRLRLIQYMLRRFDYELK